jgi:adenylyltransferase/sulfurtransferase
MQALEAIKLIANIGEPCSGRMILFDALTSRYRDIRLRPRRLDCAVCGQDPTIKKLVDYELFCGTKANDKHSGVSLLTSDERISANDYFEVKKNGEPHVLIDVRPKVELGICSIPGAVNVPFTELNDKGVPPKELIEIASDFRERLASGRPLLPSMMKFSF